MSAIIPPRIRGKVAEAEPGQGMDGKWFYTIEVATLYGEAIGAPIGPFGPFDSREIALIKLKEAAKEISDDIQKAMGQEVTGDYLDMKNGGVLRKWDEA